MEIVFQSIGICRSSRRRDSLGFVLWNWDDFLCSLRRRQSLSVVWRLFRQQLKTQRETHRSIISRMWNFCESRGSLPREYEKNGVYADVIVVDPPRKGCDEMLLKTILKMQPKRVVYVSCDSATLARDLRFLCDNGYELKKVCGVDQFPQTVHVETVVLLSKVHTPE